MNTSEYQELETSEAGYRWYRHVGSDSSSPQFVTVPEERVWDGENHEQTFGLSEAEAEDFEPREIRDLARTL